MRGSKFKLINSKITALGPHPKQVQIKEYSYELPIERIAKYPLPERDASKLLVYRGGEIKEGIYRDIDQVLPEHSLLVFNNTKVIQARLKFKNSTGAAIEIFCLEPAEENPEQASAMNQSESVTWTCLVGKAAKWREEKIHLKLNDLTLTAKRIEKIGGTFKINLSWQPESLTFAEVLSKTGEIPIPPYLKRKSEVIDQKRYQTIYAEHKGSVAAPTAGLHFTEAIFKKFAAKNIRRDNVTLHVGAGTFKPVKSKTIEDHEMHAEWIQVDIRLLENLKKALLCDSPKHPIIAVGTTTIRTLESLYWMGVKATENPNSSLQSLEVVQWDPYELPPNIPAAHALSALLIWIKASGADQLVCKTQVIIAPPYQLRIASALVTNFHQPQSTLLLLIASIVGDAWKTIYQHAMDNEYRFLSYGDGSVLFGGRV